ncbi:MAG: hypothetical protein H0T76_01670 [Nannocystis sp.]|nr:hypothetical protein [Nannocystis sp.]MBA3545171.1 hypothetical protein [Nannocystis sp.]
MKIVAIYNAKGGVSTTTLAGNLTTFAAERGVRVRAATLGPEHDLEPFIRRVGLDWHDALEGLPTEGDLLILDVHSHIRCADVLEPDLWIMPMCNRTAYENAARMLPSLTGPALWVWSSGVVYRSQVPEALRDRASFASVVIPRSPAVEASIGNYAAAWYTPDGEDSPGSRAVQALAHEVLTRLDISLAPATSLPLGPRPEGPYPSRRSFAAREEQARPRLAAYFVRRKDRA